MGDAFKAALTPVALAEHRTPGQLAVHGGLVVYTLRHVIGGIERTDLWSVSTLSGDAAALTSGPGTDHCARIRPDGEAVALIRDTGQEPAQACVLALGTTALPQVVTSFRRGVTDLAWTTEGRTLIVLAEDEASAQVHFAVGLPRDATATALVFDRTDWRSDGGDRGLRLYPQHLHSVDVATRQTRRLTSGPWSASRPRVGLDDQVYFLAHPTRGSGKLGETPTVQVFRLTQTQAALAPDAGTEAGPAAGAESASESRGSIHGADQLTRFAGGVVRYHVLEDRLRVLAYPESGRPDGVPARWFDVTDYEPPRDLLPADPRWFGLLGEETDLHEWQLELDDAPDVSSVSTDGRTTPIMLSTGGSLVDEPAVCGALAEHDGNVVAVLSFGDGRYAPDVYALGGGSPRRLTTHGDWLVPYRAPITSRSEQAGPAGPITVHLLRPPIGAKAKGAILALHGGPTGQWGVVPTVEALLLASAGYTVAMPNIRGSIDRGTDWVLPLRGAWGVVDAEDVAATCDGLARDGIVAADGLGVTGLSYGGFLTLWLVGTSDRFAAAVSENGVANQVSAWGNCDTGPDFCRSSGLGDPLSPDGVERLWSVSPLRHVGSVHTPLLMLQAAHDQICPSSDNEQFFVALRELGRKVEYVVYPEESHLMQATGRFDRRVDRHQRVVAWFDRYLGR